MGRPPNPNEFFRCVKRAGTVKDGAITSIASQFTEKLAWKLPKRSSFFTDNMIKYHEKQARKNSEHCARLYTLTDAIFNGGAYSFGQVLIHNTES